MRDLLRRLYTRYFSDHETLVLLIMLVCGFLVVIFMGHMLAPALAALVLAFLMQGIVNWLETRGLPHMAAVALVFSLFMALLLAAVFLLVPLIWQQVTGLLNELPSMVRQWRVLLHDLPTHYPAIFSVAQTRVIGDTINAHLAGLGQWFLSVSFSKLPGAFGILVYLILVPILIFFFLKDKFKLLGWLADKLPKDRRLIMQVADEMNDQIANYIRGKSIEIAIVGVVTFISFAWLGLNYSILLSVLVGLSVVVPYIGATVVTIPVAIIALFQWGWGPDFMMVMFVYGIIQALDGNVLVPLLFSEAVNLHPVAIILAVLVFGGIWGFWGVFFAIPLATLLKAVMNALPRVHEATDS